MSQATTESRAPIWKERPLRGFLLAALASNIGNWVQIFSEQWLVLLLAGSLAPRWAGRMGFASGFAVLIFTPLGGSLADKLDRRKALAAAQFFLMLLALTMGLLAWFHQLTLPRLLFFAMASGVGASVSMPMGQSLVGDLVPPEKIPAAFGLMSAQFNLSRIIGPALAAMLFPIVGVAGNFSLNALSFVGLVVVCLRLRLPTAHHEPLRGGSYGQTLRAFLADPQLSALLFMAAVWGFFAWSYFPLLPVFGSRTLGLGERGVAGLLSSFGLGAVLGSLVVARDVSGRDRFPRILIAFGGFGAGLAILGGLPHAPVAFVAMFTMGIFQATGLSLMGGTIQRKIPPGLRGRANAIYLTAIIGITPLGTLLAGEIAQALGSAGPRLVILADGLILLACASGLGLALRRSRQTVHPKP